MAEFSPAALKGKAKDREEPGLCYVRIVQFYGIRLLIVYDPLNYSAMSAYMKYQ